MDPDPFGYGDLADPDLSAGVFGMGASSGGWSFGSPNAWSPFAGEPGGGMSGSARAIDRTSGLPSGGLFGQLSDVLPRGVDNVWGLLADPSQGPNTSTPSLSNYGGLFSWSPPTEANDNGRDAPAGPSIGAPAANPASGLDDLPASSAPADDLDAKPDPLSTPQPANSPTDVPFVASPKVFLAASGQGGGGPASNGVRPLAPIHTPKGGGALMSFPAVFQANLGHGMLGQQTAAGDVVVATNRPLALSIASQATDDRDFVWTLKNEADGSTATLRPRAGKTYSLPNWGGVSLVLPDPPDAASQVISGVGDGALSGAAPIAAGLRAFGRDPPGATRQLLGGVGEAAKRAFQAELNADLHPDEGVKAWWGNASEALDAGRSLLDSLQDGDVPYRLAHAAGHGVFDATLIPAAPGANAAAAAAEEAATGELVRVAPYRKLQQELRGSGLQAHHLNQNAAYRPVIPPHKGIATPIEGHAWSDLNVPHAVLHENADRFWAPYQKGGELYGTRPTNGQYDSAMRKWLSEAGFPPEHVDFLADKAAAQKLEYNLHPDDPVPRVPRPVRRRARAP